jgi:hypothetical protein
MKKLYIFILVFSILFILLLSNNNLIYSIDFNTSLNIKPVSNYSLSKNILSMPDFYVKGIYVTGWVAGNDERLKEIIRLIDNSILNTLVIDIKDAQGYLSYTSKVELSRRIGASREKIKDIAVLLELLNNKGIYTIARIVVFKDPLLSSLRPDLALKLWDPQKQEIIISNEWVDPGEIEVWKYNIDLALEAIELGFDEVQFDYIRYPAMANSPLDVVMREEKSKSQLINAFASLVQEQISNYAPVSIDVFGLTTVANDDMGIGQNIEELSNFIEIISPMLYPSHYALGSFGLEEPVEEPYKVVFNSILSAKNKLLNKENVKLRPWLQDFSLKYKYLAEDIDAQIRALKELGIEEWLLWNPNSRYTEENLLLNLPAF